MVTGPIKRRRQAKVSIFVAIAFIFLLGTFKYDLVVRDDGAGAGINPRAIEWSVLLPAQTTLNTSNSYNQEHHRQYEDHAQGSSDQQNISTGSDNSTTRIPKLLLSVPFYVYEDLAWQGARWNGKPVRDFVNRSQIKHTDDYWFMRNALRHPMRTRNASEARLFVIPSLHNFYDSRAFFKNKHKNLCVKGVCNRKLMLSATDTVTSSPYFKNQSEAHLAVVSHFAHHWDRWSADMPDLYKAMLKRSSNIQFEDVKTNDPDRWSVPKLHVGRACPLQLHKTYDVSLTASLKPEDERFRNRGTICSWLHKYTTPTGSRNITRNHHGRELFRMQHCGKGDMCPALAAAKLGFHVRGDTPGSNRLFDILLSGTVPIFTLREQYDVLPDWFDWEAISYFMDMKTLDEASFIRSLSRIINDTQTYQQKLDLVLANRYLFDWTRVYPFDTYMYMLQAFLYPDTRHDPTTFFDLDEESRCILRLPPTPKNTNMNTNTDR